MKSATQRSDTGSTKVNRMSYWQQLLDDLSGPPRFPAPGLWVWKLLPLLLGIVATLILVAGDCDLRIQQAIYRTGGNTWQMGAHPFWQFLYHVGPCPAIGLGIAAFAGLSLSWSELRFGKWRRIFIYIALLLFLGPAVIVNFGLKNNWGRPRPLQVDSMGGKQAFEHVFVVNGSREGKSFPCGHASTGFILMAGYFLFCRHRRRLAYGWLIFGVVFGSLLGLARMLQGGHFLTDVIWVALICYYLALGLYYIVGLKDSVSREVTRRRRMPVKVRMLLVAIALLSVIAILLATPYRDSRELMLHEKWGSDVAIKLRVTLADGQTEIIASDNFHVSKRSAGHGVPTSRVSPSLWESGDGESISVLYLESKSGWFHELETETEIALPWDRIRSLQIDGHSADVFVKPAVLEGDIPLVIGPGAGSIEINLNGNKIVWGEGDRANLMGEELLETEVEIERGLILTVSEEFSGSVQLTN